MALKLEGKKQIVIDVQAMAQSAQSIIVTEYRSLKVEDIDVLRAKARAVGVCMKVVRNTLARRALESTQHDGLLSLLSGPVMLVFSYEEPSSAAKLLVQFCKEHDDIKVKALSLGDGVLGPEQLEAVSKLPTYGQAISMLLAVMNAPITQLVGATHQTYARLVRVIAAVGEQKQSSV